VRLEGGASPFAEALDCFECEDYLVLSAVVFLPWAFGGVEIWAYRLAALLLSVAGAVSLTKHGAAGLGLTRRSSWLTPAALLAVWALVQVVPLPAAAVRMLSPTAHRIYVETFPGYPDPAPDNVVLALEEAALARVPDAQTFEPPPRHDDLFQGGEGGRWRGWRTLSLLPSAGIENLFWYVALLMGFLVVRRRTRSPEVASQYRKLLFLLFASLASFGLVYTATRNDRLYWVRETLQPTHPYGPFVNPTNFAVLMEMAVPWIVGHVIFQLQSSRRRWVAILERPVFVAASLLCLASGLLAGSKLAAVLLVTSVTFMVVLGASRARTRWALAGGAVLIWSAIAMLLRGSVLGERVRQFLDTGGVDLNELGRVAAWKASLPMLRDFLISGSGFGSFEDVFQGYVSGGTTGRYNAAHNDYLELLLEGGLVAAVLLVWLVIAFWSRALAAAPGAGRLWQDPERLGLVVGLAAISLHAWVDYNHQIPAVGLVFVALSAMAIARTESEPEPG